MTVSGCAA